jgi:hypothetical protein
VLQGINLNLETRNDSILTPTRSSIAVYELDYSTPGSLRKYGPFHLLGVQGVVNETVIHGNILAAIVVDLSNVHDLNASHSVILINWRSGRYTRLVPSLPEVRFLQISQQSLS